MYLTEMDNLKQEHDAEINQLKAQHMNEVQELLVSNGLHDHMIT